MPTKPLNRRCKFEARGLRRVSLLWSWPPFFVMLSTLEEAQKQIGAAKTFSGKRMPSRSLDEEVLLGCELFVRRKTTWNHPRNLGTNILNPRSNSYSSNSHFKSAGASKETQQEQLVASALFLMFNPFIRDPIVSHAIVSLSILFLAYFAWQLPSYFTHPSILLCL